MRKLFVLLALFWSIAAHAEILENDPRIKISTIEPARDVGYTVGDVVSRTVILESPKNLTLFDTSIPIVGNEKKRRGKGSGIELKQVSFERHPGVTSNSYTLRLTYQIFTTGVTAKPASLPPEFVKFGGEGEKSFEVRIPSWSFRISPLAVFGSVVVEKDMSGFQGPLLLDSSRPRQLLWGLLGLLGAALLGLLYVLGTSTWLPRMGGPFARALRDLKKLPDNAEGLSQGVSRLHQALNATAGGSVFEAKAFIERKPSFVPVGSEIERFFGLSRTVFFEPRAAHGIENPMAWLKQFCRRCRDCERGLK
jgi:mxaA protein